MRSLTLNDLIDAVGVDAAFSLSRHFPGYNIYVPKQPSEARVLAQVLQEEELGKLCATFSGETIRVPGALARYSYLIARNQRIRRGKEEGKTLLEISRDEGLTYHFIRNILNGIDPEPPVEGLRRKNDKQTELEL